jgi:hypothetical protein
VALRENGQKGVAVASKPDLVMPHEVQQVCDAWVAHALDGAPVPENSQLLEEWLEYDGWDLVVGAGANEDIVVKLWMLAEDHFRDGEVEGEEDLEEEGVVTDADRLRHARRWIKHAMSCDDGYLCPSAYSLPIRDVAGREAMLGLTMPIHGQGGPVIVCHGAYKTADGFLADLRQNNYLLVAHRNFKRSGL